MTLQQILNLINQANSIQDFAKYNLLKLADSGDGRYILNYDEQGLDTPKSWISHYCRALTLAGEPNNYSIIAKAFDRFYNLGEAPEYLNGGDQIDFTKPFFADLKHDGSLILLYFWNGEWRVNTRGSFAQGKVSELYDGTWEDLFWEAFKSSGYRIGVFEKESTYIFELCTPYNQVVEYYENNKVELMLEIFNLKEICHTRPIICNSFEDVTRMLSGLKPTQEGFVLRQYDNINHKWIRRKVKTASWCALAHLKDSALQSDSKLWNVVFQGEMDEVISVFPHLRDKLEEKDKFYKELLVIIKVTQIQYRDIEDQKEFALTIKDLKYKNVLFQLRRNGLDDIKKYVQEFIIKNH